APVCVIHAPDSRNTALPGCVPARSLRTGIVSVEVPPVYSTTIAYGTPAVTKNGLIVKSNLTSVTAGQGLKDDTSTGADVANGDPVGRAVDPGAPLTAYNFATMVPVGLFSLLR